MSAFYSLPEWLFYRLADAVRGDGFTILLPRLHVRAQLEAVVHRASEVLLAAEISLCGLYRHMPQQEVNLLKLATTCSGIISRTFARKSCGAMWSNPTLSQQVLTTYQTTFCERLSPHTFPVLATARNILPPLIPAASVH